MVTEQRAKLDQMMQQRAVRDGEACGRLDGLIGYRSRYAWHGVTLESPTSYTYWYSIGYRKAQNS